LYRKSYDAALNDIALALQRIFSAKLVILRDGAPNERFGAAPSEVDARSWLETLDHPHDGGMTARTFLAEEQDIRPPDDSIGRLVFVPLRSSNEGALWLGFAKRVACSADDLTGLKLLGEYLALALSQAAAASGNGLHATNGASLATIPTDSDADELIAIAAHELRTPLTPITMLLQAMERKAKISGGDFESLQRTRKQVQRLTTMISELLDLSRLRRERLALTPVAVEIGSTLTESVRTFRESDPRRLVELTISSEPLYVRADELRLLQSISNLLGHVARTSPADSPIHVTLERRGTQACVTMQADRPSFESSTASNGSVSNAPVSPTRSSRHVGLAVLLAEAVVRRFDGSVTVDGQSNREARAEASFPLVPPENP